MRSCRQRELRSVVVTSAASGDGKTTVALNLAMADASADMRRPSVADLLGLRGGGLATYLAQPATKLADSIQRVPATSGVNGSSVPEMDVALSGTIPAKPERAHQFRADARPHRRGRAAV